MSIFEVSELLGNFGEFFGAIAVLVTLVYLSRQVRQNTVAVQGSTDLEASKMFVDWHARAVGLPEIQKLWWKDANNEMMTEDELRLFLWHLAETFFIGEGLYRQHKKGLLTDESWRPWRNFLVGLVQEGRLRDWWDEGYVPYSEEFRYYINQELESGSSWRIPDLAALAEKERLDQ